MEPALVGVDAQLTTRSGQHRHPVARSWVSGSRPPFREPTGLPARRHRLAGCPDPHHRCRSGKYTLLLDVTDTLGNHYYDTQQVWFDNKPMVSDKHVLFAGHRRAAGCTAHEPDASSIPPGAPCGVPGRSACSASPTTSTSTRPTLSYPSDNFDFYSLSITQAGRPDLRADPPSLAPPDLGPIRSTESRGAASRATRCEPLPAGGHGLPGAAVDPADSRSDVLTTLDLRVFDARVRSGACRLRRTPCRPASRSKRGTCCGYTFQLYAQDKTLERRPAGDFHQRVVAAVGGLHLQRYRPAPRQHDRVIESSSSKGGELDAVLRSEARSSRAFG